MGDISEAPDRSKLGKCELQCVSPSQLATANAIGKTKYEPFGAYYSLLRSPTRELGATEQLGNKLTSLTLAIHGKHILAQLGAATPYPGRLVQYILPVKQPHPTIQRLLKSHNQLQGYQLVRCCNTPAVWAPCQFVAS